MECAATQEEIFAPTEISLDKTTKYIQDHAMYLDENSWDKDKKLLALSTCKYPDTADRTIVVGTLGITAFFLGAVIFLKKLSYKNRCFF